MIHEVSTEFANTPLAHISLPTPHAFDWQTSGISLPETVTQSELERIARHRQDHRTVEVIRRSVIDRLKRGASIEPGQRHAWVQQSSSTRFTESRLIGLIGEAKTNELKALLPSSVIDALRIK